jgi:hypothetical protein
MSDKNLQDIKDAITDAGRALLAYSKTGSVFLPLDGDLYVAVGSLAGIAHVAGKSIDEAAPTAQAPSQVPAELTDELIEELFMPLMAELPAKSALQQFARAIERELRAGSSDVRDQALEEAAQICQAMYDSGDGGSGCVLAAHKILELKAEAPAASKEGGAA